jgi:hypothetical protein
LQNPAIFDWQMFYFSDILNRFGAAEFQFDGAMPIDRIDKNSNRCVERVH